MTAPFGWRNHNHNQTMKTIKPMLAKRYDEYQDPSGYWMSEKLDGVRAVWDGSDFKSRNGKTFPAPDHIKAAMPQNVILDGEIFSGRGKFQTTLSSVKVGKWDDLEFVIFDIITCDTFEDRIETLAHVTLPPFCRRLEQIKCKSRAHLDVFEGDILSKRGEGVILRKAGSKYSHGRSPNLLKVKRFQTDEATVVGYQDGQGKHTGRIGAIVAEYCGKVFKLGTGLSDNQRETPPAIGDPVTFSYFELTDGGVPRHPVFIAARTYE